MRATAHARTTAVPGLPGGTRDRAVEHSDLHYSAQGSTDMYALHEALAREHMRERESQARRHRMVRELSAARRWRYVERRADRAYRRHALRADLAQVSRTG